MSERVTPPPRETLTGRAREFAYPDTPWAMRLVNRATRPVNRRLWRLEPEELIRAAREKSGLSEFDEAAPLDEPLDIVCRAANAQPGLHSIGRLSLRHVLLGNLVNRLRVHDAVTRHPEIHGEPVDDPLVVAGINRSGTTFLQRLLSRDTRLRGIPFWQVMSPLPTGPLDAPPADPDPRIRAGAAALRFTYWRAPDLVDMHEMINDEPDEEIPILAMAFASPLYQYMAVLPEFVDWYNRTDHTAGYRYFRTVLQVMQWHQPGGRWLLKSPSHLEMLTPLLGAFPQATVVQTHRDPVTAVISLSSLTVYGQRANLEHPDPHLVGRISADFVERLLRASIKDRPDGDKRFVDVPFQSLVTDPIGEVNRVYQAAGLSLDGATEHRMRAWIDREQPRQGRHSYAAEDFDLDVRALRERFGFYYEHFGVPVDG